MNKYICIHCHFYQPPRENPWLEQIELQDSAYPYHDWNERITAECYAPNSASRILDFDNKIIDIINNYTRISFNFGPTLLLWLEQYQPDLYNAIIQADRLSQKKYSGHGSALAQAYNHMIMPLANRRDKQTQIIWGIRDFEHRFRRKPEGMWLPETAVDLETLDSMAEHGVKFTILAPHQAKRAKKINNENWLDVSDGTVNPRQNYLCRLPSGKIMNIFFYDGPISQNIAFGDTLKSGHTFAEKLNSAFIEDEETAQLVHIATDGETYGHHHSHGDMALAYCFHHIESNDLAHITVYGEFLEKNPPVYEVEIIENSSWSCIHGIERWRNNCGCNTGMHADWNQEWRAPLRLALDWLRDEIALIYEREMASFVDDPWKTRNEYIEVLLDRTFQNNEQFISNQANRELNKKEKIIFFKLLEMQRHAMLMFTSCGWFFDEISGIETTQVIQYASRALQLAGEVNNKNLEKAFISRLENAKSNLPEFKNGAHVYNLFVKPAILDLNRISAHYAMSSLFKEYQEEMEIFCYTTKSDEYDLSEAGIQKLAIGKVNIQSDITLEERDIAFSVLYLGSHNILCGIREFKGEDSFLSMKEEIKSAFLKSDISGVIQSLNSHFKDRQYSLWHLFKDEQRKVFDMILTTTFEEIETYFRQISEHHYPIMQAMREMNIPLPKAFSTPMEFILNKDLVNILEIENIDFEELRKTVDKIRHLSLELDKTTTNFITSRKINTAFEKLLHNYEDLSLVKNIKKVFKILNPLHLNLDVWKAQTIYFRIGKKHYPLVKEKAEKGDENAREWIECFENLGKYLNIGGITDVHPGSDVQASV